MCLEEWYSVRTAEKFAMRRSIELKIRADTRYSTCSLQQSCNVNTWLMVRLKVSRCTVLQDHQTYEQPLFVHSDDDEGR